MWIVPGALVKYLAKTWLPWLMALCATASMSVQAFYHRENCDRQIADAVSSAEAVWAKTPPPASSGPWISIGVGTSPADGDGLKLVHETALLPHSADSCLVRGTVALFEVDEEDQILRQGGLVNITIEKVDDCSALIEIYGPPCPDPRRPGCNPTNGPKPL